MTDMRKTRGVAWVMTMNAYENVLRQSDQAAAVEWTISNDGHLAGFEGAGVAERMRDPMDLLELDVDLLIPAVPENQFTARYAHEVRAKIVAVRIGITR